MATKYWELKEAIERVEMVDAHAHNIVDLDSSFPFLRCFSEAEGDALSYASHALSFKRSLRDIASLYGCEASLDVIESYRRLSGLHSIGSKCFDASKISLIFIDDGIEFDKMLDIEWHKSFGPAVGRILRIERLAEKIIDQELPSGCSWTLDMFTEIFMMNLKSLADKVVALKSIAAYRSGLEIDTHVSKKDAEEGLFQELRGKKPIRIQNKFFIDYVFTCSLEVASSYELPIQIHTGFGDKDLDLRYSNPLHLRILLEDSRFSKCQIVLLHASYPFSKEASFLASIYSQVYLDFGLAVPKLSMHGMISSIKELLELAPIKKVMFSSDGYAFPETYYLGAKRAREIVLSVLSDACDSGDLTTPEAVEAIEDIFKGNAHRLYKMNCISDRAVRKTNSYNMELTTKSKPEGVVFVRILWVDGSGQHRCRVVPAERFYGVVKNNGIGLTIASMGMSSFCDGPAEGTNLTAVGEIRLLPDLSTKQMLPWAPQEEMVLADMQLKPGVAWEYCPREALRRISKFLKDEFNLEMKAGFENEFYLLRNISRDGCEKWAPFDLSPYCSTSGFDSASPILQEVNAALEAMGIHTDQLHAESGKGQFEIALSYTKCTHVADKLVYAREAIRSVARKHKLLATFVPKYALDDIGSGSHVHLSLWENGKNIFMAADGSGTQYGMSSIGEEFMAGVFHHLPSIFAFTAPLPNSYDRIQPSTWSGAYLCWGRENREAPLRTACPPGISNELVSNFELKSFDGCANPYLGLASIMAAGLDGLRRKLKLPEPVETDPSLHADKLQRLPKELGESIQALEKDEFMKDLIGRKLVTAIIGIRKAEAEYYKSDAHGEKRLMLIHKY